MSHSVVLTRADGSFFVLTCYGHSDRSIIAKTKGYYEEKYGLHACITNTVGTVIYESPFESTFTCVSQQP